MPLPAIGAVLGAVGAIVGFFVVPELKERATREIGKVCAQAVLEKMGIPLDLDGEVNHQTITAAINEGVLGGQIEFTDLFDRDAVEADIKRIAIEQAGASFGFEGGLSIDAIKERLIGEVMAEVQENIAQGGGEYAEAALDLAGVLRNINRPRVDDWAEIKNFSKEGEQNRARQETYRNSHSRRWI